MECVRAAAAVPATVGRVFRRVLVVCLLLAIAGCGRPVPGPPRGLAVLTAWDQARATAWAAGDPGALSALYVPGSVAGQRDVALLGTYAARGLRVVGMTRQVLRAQVLVDRPGLIRIDLTDRLAAAAAERPEEPVAVPLPSTMPRRRVVELRRVRGRWLMARVVSATSPRRGRP